MHLCAIALEQEETRQRIHQLAYFDALTGLPNHVSFQQQGSAAVAAAVRKGESLAIHLVDLDDFKGVNDTLGHEASDMLLASAARRFSARLGPGEIIARIADTIEELRDLPIRRLARQLADQRQGKQLEQPEDGRGRPRSFFGKLTSAQRQEIPRV